MERMCRQVACGLGRQAALEVSEQLDDVGMREQKGEEAVVRAGGRMWDGGAGPQLCVNR